MVISSAVSPQNPEVTAAKAKQIPVIPRAEMLAELMRLKFGVAIAGAHGKTTTTSMVANVLAQGGLDPTMVIGGKVNALGSHARLGRGELLVAEADESDGSFLRLSPTIIAVTNLDREHLDHYGSMERIYESFLEFINKVPFYGLAVLCADDHRLRGLFPNIVKRYYTYGLSESDGVTSDFRATDIVAKQGGSEFRAFFRTRNLGPFRLAVPGIHNVSNALAAIAIGVELDVPVDLIRKALAAFTGVERRFHIRGESNGVMVVDDYGHHPTEIKATLAAAKQGWPERRLVVLFQRIATRGPETYWRIFPRHFKMPIASLTEIYAASESPIPGVSGARLAEAIRAVGHPPVTFVERKDKLTEQVLPQLKAGDLVITLGARRHLEDRACITGAGAASWPCDERRWTTNEESPGRDPDSTARVWKPSWQIFAVASASTRRWRPIPPSRSAGLPMCLWSRLTSKYSPARQPSERSTHSHIRARRDESSHPRRRDSRHRGEFVEASRDT